MDEFDRVFDGQDVGGLPLVDGVEHGRQRGAFARAGRAGHQHQPAGAGDQFVEDGRRAQRCQRGNPVGNGTEYRAGAPALHEQVDPEARQAGQLERQVQLQLLFVMAALRRAQDGVHHALHIIVRQRGQVDAAHVAMHADHRRQPGRQVQVGCLLVDGKGEQFGNIHARLRHRWGSGGMGTTGSKRAADGSRHVPAPTGVIP